MTQQSKRKRAPSNASSSWGANLYEDDDDDNNDDDNNDNATTIAMVCNDKDDDAPGPRPKNANSIPVLVSSPSIVLQHAAPNLKDDKHDDRGEEEDNGGGWEALSERMAEYRPNNLAPATLYPRLVMAIPRIGTVVAAPTQQQRTTGAIVVVMVVVIVFAISAKEQSSDGQRPDVDNDDEGAVGDDETAKAGGKGRMTKAVGTTQR